MCHLIFVREEDALRSNYILDVIKIENAHNFRHVKYMYNITTYILHLLGFIGESSPSVPRSVCSTASGSFSLTSL